MSYLRFADQADGVKVFFDDATAAGRFNGDGHRHARPDERPHGQVL